MFSVRQGMNCYVFIDINLRSIPVSVRIQRNKLSSATAGLARLLLLFSKFSCRQPCVQSMSLCPSFCLYVTYYQHINSMSNFHDILYRISLRKFFEQAWGFLKPATGPPIIIYGISMFIEISRVKVRSAYLQELKLSEEGKFKKIGTA